ncbi:MAG: Gfo/Idh/MocA family oxidoreductase [Tepidisphaeraceae bacterium]|jgi:predicted dehydrogenase
MSDQRLKIGIIGAGYWGPNLVRNFCTCPATEAVAVCDANAERLAKIGRQFQHLKLFKSVDEFLEHPLDAVAIATPVSTHFQLAKRCLEAGKHVLVEKPLTATSEESRTLIELAARMGKVLMVDHTYLFNPAIRKIRQIVDSGELGEIYYVDSVRINLGLFQHDINVVWDLVPHDLSIVDYVLGLEARSISAWGCAHTDSGVEDIAYVNVDFGDRMLASFHVNWLSPVKVRQMIFAGSRKSVIFNELNATEPVKVYDRGIELGHGDIREEDRRKMLIQYRSGDCLSPFIEPAEALQGMAAHFAHCIRGGHTPVSDGLLGLRVVEMLESANRSLRSQGARIALSGQMNHGNRNGKTEASQVRPVKFSAHRA